jgi:hypothetical protein
MKSSSIAGGLVMIALAGCGGSGDLGTSGESESRVTAIPLPEATEDANRSNLAPLLDRIGDLSEKYNRSQKIAAQFVVDGDIAAAQAELVRSKSYLTRNRVNIDEIDRLELRKIFLAGWRNSKQNVDGLEAVIRGLSEGDEEGYRAGLADVLEADKKAQALSKSDPFQNVDLSAEERAAIAGQ